MLARFLKSQDGVAAIEFAILLPMLVGMLVGTIDIGFAIQAKMKMNALLRSVANVAMSGADLATVTAAQAQILAHSADPLMADMILETPVSFYACPEAMDVSISNAPDQSTLCAGNAATVQVYQFSATMQYRSLFFAGSASFPLNATLRIQVP